VPLHRLSQHRRCDKKSRGELCEMRNAIRAKKMRASQ
jgi:hypothetical protein